MGKSCWPERDAELRALSAEGLSAGLTAKRMNLTRDQVIGRRKRLGIHGPARVRVTSTVARKPKPWHSTARPAPPGTVGCHWPLWKISERPTHRYCGAIRRDAACPYCSSHAAVAFTGRWAAAVFSA